MSQGPYQPPQYPYPPQAPGFMPPPQPAGTNGLAITAGVLLILVAVMDLFGGLFCAMGGTLAAAIGRNTTATAVDESGNPQPHGEIEVLVEAGSFLQLLGFALVILFALTLAAGILLFMAKAPTFVMAVGALQILADLASCVMLEHIGVLNIVGLITGALAIAAALSINKKVQAMPAV